MIFGFSIFPVTGYSADQSSEKTAVAFRLNSQDIEIDGKLNDPGWQSAQAYDGFTQRDPSDGKPASFPTSFRIVYDDEYLYVGINAIDPQIDQIEAILTRRDEYTESDWVYISLDSYNDNRTAFEFGLNAAGVQHDLRRYDDNNADDDWNAVWDGAVEIHNAGWSAEFRIPFRELRFTSSAQMRWGLQIYRELPRNNELAVWNYWSKDETGFVSQYGTLEGLSNVESTRPLYISPYILGQSNHSDQIQSMSQSNPWSHTSNIGGDIRYTFSNGLTMNATVNPDFGQVEADPADFNLTEFESYFAEKRPFFKEGSDILNFNDALYYSRRIGARPAKILAAGKLTGKTTNGTSIGVMNATTGEGFSTLTDLPSTSSSEPLTNYFLARLQRDYHEGQTTFGGLMTSVNRRLNDATRQHLHSDAYTGGIDFSHEFLNREYEIEGVFAGSHVLGAPMAITQTQRSSARYFQRPDADYLSVDTTATSLSGIGHELSISKISGHWRGSFVTSSSSPGLEVNDLGFLQRVDEISQNLWIQYREWEETKYYQELYLNVNQWTGFNYGGRLLNKGGNVNAHATLLNNWDIGGGFNFNFPGINLTELRGGPAIYAPANRNVWGYIETDSRKDFSYELFSHYFINTDNVTRYEISQAFNIRPRQNIQLLFNPSFVEFSDTWAWVGKAYDTNNEPHYLFSGLLQKELYLTVRIDYTIRPNLSIQYYAQPYFTAGSRNKYVETADLMASDFDERFSSLDNYDVNYNEHTDQYEYDITGDGTVDYFSGGSPRGDFNYKQFRSNLVIRWEYVSGSTMYLVWSQGFTEATGMGELQLNRDFKSLFHAPGENVLLLKISYLMNV